jgi:hypothetical protein
MQSVRCASPEHSKNDQPLAEQRTWRLIVRVPDAHATASRTASPVG